MLEQLQAFGDVRNWPSLILVIGVVVGTIYLLLH